MQQFKQQTNNTNTVLFLVCFVVLIIAFIIGVHTGLVYMPKY